MTETMEAVARLKREHHAVIAAHTYQSPEVQACADILGDSFALAQKAAATDADTVFLCGVRFMAETCKILSPEKKVYLPKSEAACPMADQLDPDMLIQLKERYPDYKVVAYINTTAQLKTLCDVCVTSSSAVKIIKNMDADKILFIPDCNLGSYIRKMVPEKQFKLISGGCPTHARLTVRDIQLARAAHPGAPVLVHPECQPAVVEAADFAGSTTEIMKYAIDSKEKSFIIGTENSIVQHLSIDCPDKMFYALSKDCVCHNMKITNITDVLHCLEGTDGEEIVLDDDVITKAKVCIDEMLRLG